MNKHKFDLRVQFGFWIFGGLIALLIAPLWIKQSLCRQELPETLSVKAYKEAKYYERGSDSMNISMRLEQYRASYQSYDSKKVYSVNLTPAWLCEEAKTTDIALVFFTYCLVIVGWFGIRSGEKNVRELERAHIFGGPHRGQAIIVGDKALVHITIQNSGRSAAILKKIYAEFSETEPSGDNPTYSDPSGKSVRYDMGIPANFIVEQPVTMEPFESKILTPHFMLGYIEYVDVFNVTHTNRFCNKIYPGGRRGDVAGSPAYNDWD